MADKEKQQAADENKIDHYVKQGLIATGKHAQVWEVQEENTSNRFALKVLLAEAMLDPKQIAIMKFEGKVAQALDHPNIIKWIATVHRKTNVYLVLELFRALNIKNFLANDTLGVQMRLRKVIECVCQALQHMHERGWAHLDVKPDNILLNKSSEVKLIDFSLSQKIKSGIGKLLGGGGKDIGGTLTYIAPETLRKEALTAQTDIYSLGITIFECLTGTTPFKGSSPKDLMLKQLSAVPAAPSEYNKNVAPEMDRMVLRMLAKKPANRQKNMQEVISEFRNVQKIFKEDPEKLFEQKALEAKEGDKQQSLGKRLDSRTDHRRSEEIKTNPEMAKQLAASANPPTQPKAVVKSPQPAAASKAPAKPQPAAVPPLRPPAMPMPQPMAASFPPPM
ncbi:MAG TPA: serine/threonine-protein kinase, partial [Planctomycetaceae bacterium]|nr:serine/threonine-protein kinase [Planctomycetaceae bacterium]